MAFVFLLVALPVVYRMTRELDYRWNAPVIVPGGIPVDLSATAKVQHEAAMGTAAPSLVQILPVATPTQSPENPSTDHP